MAASLQEEARAIMRHAAAGGVQTTLRALEFLSHKKPNGQAVFKEVLFKPGDIVERGEEGEEAERKA